MNNDDLFWNERESSEGCGYGDRLENSHVGNGYGGGDWHGVEKRLRDFSGFYLYNAFQGHIKSQGFFG